MIIFTKPPRLSKYTLYFVGFKSGIKAECKVYKAQMVMNIVCASIRVPLHITIRAHWCDRR